MKILGSLLVASIAAIGPALADPQSSNRLNLVVQPEPTSLMLGLIQNAPSQLVSGSIYESLLKFDENLNPLPQLAKSWQVSDDGLMYTFDLRSDVKWHDGEPFTAKDVVFSSDAFLRETAARFRIILQNVESIEADGDYRVVFKLKTPFAPFLGTFEVGTAPMVPKHLYEGTNFQTNPANETPIGTGPFKFGNWERGSYIRLEKNADYYEENRPLLNEVYWHVIPDASSRAVAYETGVIDVLPGGSVENFDVERLSRLPNSCITDKGWELFGPMAWMWMNNRTGATADVKFRQAVMYALDRQFSLDTLWNGYGRIASGPLASTTRFFTDKYARYNHDIEKAKALLEESGYNGETVRLLPLPYGETWQRWAELVKQNLADAGINTEIVSTDVAGWNQRLSNWDFDMAFTYSFQYGDPALGVSRNYVSSNIAQGSPFNNVAGYSSKEIDKLFDIAAQTIDDDKRSALYDELQEKLTEDVPVAWLQELRFPTIYRCNIKNLVSSAIGLNDSLKNTYVEK